MIIMQTQTWVGSMDAGSTGIPREFLLKQIENEVKAGFSLLEVTRRILGQDAPSQGGGNRNRIADPLADSTVARVRALIQQVTELREATLHAMQSEPAP
jgi:hypothetical protein